MLCDGISEEVDHLFFRCGFSKLIWKEVPRRNGLTRDTDNWTGESVKAEVETKGKNFQAYLRCLTLAAAVYFTWQERNNRIFSRELHDWQFVLQKIEGLVKEATWDWRAPRTFQNWILCKEWGLCDYKVFS